MKKIIGTVFFAVFACVAGYSVYVSQQQKNELSDLEMANVEALADDESSEKGCKLHLTSICETSNKDHYLYRNR